MPDRLHDLQLLPVQECPRQLAALLKATEDAVIGHTPENLICYWNRSAERLYGYDRQEILGQPITVLLPPERRAEAQELLGRVTRGETISHWSTVHITRDGRFLDVDLSVTAATGAAGQITSAWTLARDMTQQKQTEQALRQLQLYAADRTVVLEAANHVAFDILTSQTGTEALRHIAEAARHLTRAQYAALGVARLDGKGLLEFVTVGLSPEEEAQIGSRPQGLGLLRLLLQRTEPLRVDTLAEHFASSGFPPHHPPMDSFLGVPIRRGDSVLGSLYLTNKAGGGPFLEADAVAVEALGAHAAVAIHNWHLLSRQRALLRGLIMGQEEERRTVAYDLHDGLTQYVMASHAHLETAWRVQESGDHDRARREMTQGMSYLKHAVLESRRMVNGLRALTLDELGLAGTLEQLLEEEKARAGWEETRFTHNVDQRRFDFTLESTAYRVAQEALNNARKHARTTRLHVMLLLTEEASSGKEELRLEIQDWGVGFVPEVKLQETERVGLHSMAERVSLIGGIYTLQSAPGEGTLIQAVFPVPHSQGDVLRGNQLPLDESRGL